MMIVEQIWAGWWEREAKQLFWGTFPAFIISIIQVFPFKCFSSRYANVRFVDSSALLLRRSCIKLIAKVFNCSSRRRKLTKSRKFPRINKDRVFLCCFNGAFDHFRFLFLRPKRKLPSKWFLSFFSRLTSSFVMHIKYRDFIDTEWMRLSFLLHMLSSCICLG